MQNPDTVALPLLRREVAEMRYFDHGGRVYELTLASDVVPDGLGVEL